MEEWTPCLKVRWNDECLSDGASYRVNRGPKFLESEIEVKGLVLWLKLSAAVRKRCRERNKVFSPAQRPVHH